MATWIGRWLGGRIRQGPHGTKNYVLERQIKGKRRQLGLGSNEKHAEAELALFTRDPLAYLTKLEAKELAAEEERKKTLEGVDLREGLYDQFEAHMKSKGLSRHHIANTLGYLGWWDTALTKRCGRGWDLRRVALTQLKTCLDTETTARRKRAMALKRYTRWLREEAGLLHPSQDPTLALTVETAAPARVKRQRGYALDHVEAVYKAITSQVIRDVIRIHCTTGWHNTEIVRLASGNGEILEVEGHGEIAAVVRVLHKKKREHAQSIPALTLAAIKRLRARGRAPEEKWVTTVLKEASTAATRPRINYGELRHSFTAWAETGGRLVRPSANGVPLNEISVALGHTSLRTTQVNYRVTAVPPMVTVPVKLFHPDDPLPFTAVPAAHKG